LTETFTQVGKEREREKKVNSPLIGYVEKDIIIQNPVMDQYSALKNSPDGLASLRSPNLTFHKKIIYLLIYLK